jgi:hypothetical protein
MLKLPESAVVIDAPSVEYTHMFPTSSGAKSPRGSGTATAARKRIHRLVRIYLISVFATDFNISLYGRPINHEGNYPFSRRKQAGTGTPFLNVVKLTVI